MKQRKMTMHVTIDLTSPKAAESRKAVTRRCIATIDDIRLGMPVVFNDPRLRADIGTFLDDMKLFFEPALPAELVTFLREWNSLRGGPAA